MARLKEPSPLENLTLYALKFCVMLSSCAYIRSLTARNLADGGNTPENPYCKFTRLPGLQAEGYLYPNRKVEPNGALPTGEEHEARRTRVGGYCLPNKKILSEIGHKTDKASGFQTEILDS